MAIVIAGIALAPIFRGFAFVIDHRSMLTWFPAVEDALASGCLIAILGSKLDRVRPWIDRFIVPIAILALALPGFHYPYGVQPTVSITLLNLVIALCIEHCTRHRYAFLNNPPIEWVGRLSYSLYLWQEPFLFLKNVHAWWTTFPVNILLAVACACASHYLVEKPFLRLRERRKAIKLVAASA